MSTQAQLILTATNLGDDQISLNFKVEFTTPVSNDNLDDVSPADIVVADLGRVVAKAIRENYGAKILPGE